MKAKDFPIHHAYSNTHLSDQVDSCLGPTQTAIQYAKIGKQYRLQPASDELIKLYYSV